MWLSFRQNQLFKIHAIGAVALDAISFIAWVFTAFFVSMMPWFLFIWAVTGLSLPAHYYIFVRPVPQLLPLHVAWFSVLNTAIITTWLITGPYGKAWFMEFFAATLVLLATHYILALNKTSPNKWIYTHATVYATFNLFLFTLWLDIGKGYPWFLYVIPALAIFLGAHYVFHFKTDNLLLKLHAVIFANVQAILFIAWATTGGFPWFVFPFIGWGALFGAHIFLTLRRNRANTTVGGTGS